MALQFNTFRPDRYFRSSFVEGRYLLSSEASDLELEIIDLLRRMTKDLIGDVAVSEAWQVTRLSATQILITPGQAWFNGLPFEFRFGQDELVSPSSYAPSGYAPPGPVLISNDPNGLGKIVTFVEGVTPTNTYRIVIKAQEQLITSVQDPFLQNADLTEPTANKLRLTLTINVVVDSIQSTVANTSVSPIPYAGDDSSVYNYSTAVLSNSIVVTPQAGSPGVGQVTIIGATTTSPEVDGSTLELTVYNPIGGNPLPIGNVDQLGFEYGLLTDNYGNNYNITAVFNSTSTNYTVIRIGLEPGQPVPTTSNFNGGTYTLTKGDVYAQSDINGAPQGRLFWSIAKVNWNTTSGIVHSSDITDLRGNIISEASYEAIINAKFDMVLSGGGVIGFATDGQTLSWSTAFTLVNPAGPAQTIRLGSQVLLPGGGLVYNLNLASGGNIDLGSKVVTVSSNASTVASLLGTPSLANVRLGNVLVLGSQTVYITAIDDVNKTLTLSAALSTTGSATIYLDSFAPGTAPSNEYTFTLAILNNSIVTVGGILDLTAGHSNAIYDERTLFPSGLATSTTITLPVNTRNSSNPQYYNPLNGELKVYVNQLLKFQGADWISISNNTLQFIYALSDDSEVHFRIDSTPAGSIGGGTGSGAGTLQTAYTNGNIITTTSGVPFTVTPAISGSGKVAVFNGDIDVTGVIDPKGLQLDAQTSNPLGGYGIWADTAGDLVYEGVSPVNITQTLVTLASSSNITAGSGLNKTGNTLSVTSAPTIISPVTTGQGYSANTSYIVRWGIPNNSETPDQVYVANAATASNLNYQAIGVIAPGAVGSGEPANLTIDGTYTLASLDPTFSNAQIGLPVYLTNDGTGGFTTTPSTTPGDAQVQVGVVQSNTQVWLNFKDIGEIVPVPQYDEIIYYASGLASPTSILIPLNSRNSNVQETYSSTGGDLEVYVNDLFKVQQTTENPTADWYSIDSSHIAFTFDLTNDSIVHFRKNPLASGILAVVGGGGGGTETLQQAYNNGSAITVTSGNPFTVGGAGSKVAVFNGNITVTGTVDPTGIQLLPQSSNPLTSGQSGLWLDNSGNLQQQASSSAVNITSVINSVIAGTAQTTISNTYSNTTGVTIAAFSPVYAISSGHAALADGTSNSKFQVVGLTTAAILNSGTGPVAYSGYLTGVSGLTQGAYVYLGLAPGTLTSTPPTLGGGYPSGFNVVKIGVADGTTLILQIQDIGTL